MAVKFVQENEAPQPLHGRGTISSSQEYRDAMNAIRAIKPGQAIVITIESPELLKKDKAEISFANALRRYLATNGLAATAYQSGKSEVVVRKGNPVGTKRKK